MPWAGWVLPKESEEQHKPHRKSVYLVKNRWRDWQTVSYDPDFSGDEQKGLKLATFLAPLPFQTKHSGPLLHRLELYVGTTHQSVRRGRLQLSWQAEEDATPTG